MEFIPLWGGQAANLPRFGVGIGNVGQIGVGRLDSVSDWVGLQRVRPTLGGAPNPGQMCLGLGRAGGCPALGRAGGRCPALGWAFMSHLSSHLYSHRFYRGLAYVRFAPLAGYVADRDPVASARIGAS